MHAIARLIRNRHAMVNIYMARLILPFSNCHLIANSLWDTAVCTYRTTSNQHKSHPTSTNHLQSSPTTSNYLQSVPNNSNYIQPPPPINSNQPLSTTCQLQPPPINSNHPNSTPTSTNQPHPVTF